MSVLYKLNRDVGGRCRWGMNKGRYLEGLEDCLHTTKTKSKIARHLLDVVEKSSITPASAIDWNQGKSEIKLGNRKHGEGWEDGGDIWWGGLRRGSCHLTPAQLGLI
jgi:hypothetical protein